MSDRLRHRTVAVAVIYDAAQHAFLLWNNPRWHGYAFPMKRFNPLEAVDPASEALRALQGREVPLSLPHASAGPIDRHGECEFSEGAHQYTYYDYHVYGIDPGQPLPASELHPDLRWYTYEQLIAAPNVTWSTKSIARSLVEERRVALAVITRPGPRGRECLLVRNKSGQFFFPATRMKTDLVAAQAVAQAVRNDLGYDGPFRVADEAEAVDVQASGRFGPRPGRFVFHVCRLEFPAAGDLSASGNDLDESLRALQSAPDEASATAASDWDWFTAEDLQTRSDLSPTIPSVRNTVLHWIRE